MAGFILQNVLAITARLVNNKLKTSMKLQQILTERQQDIFQVRIANGKGGHFVIQENKVLFSRKIHPNPTFEQTWKGEWVALKTMLSKDETDFLRAFEDNQYDFRGDFTLALWFNEVMKNVQKK